LLGVVREQRICWGSNVACSEIGEQRIFARAAVAVAVVAFRLAAEQLVAQLLRGSELRLASLYRIELGSECRHLRRDLVVSDRLRHLVEGGGSAAAIELADMDRHRLVCRRRTGPIAHLLGVGGPLNGKGLWTPDCFEQRPIGTLRCAVHRAGDIGQAHLDRVGRRSLSLLGCWIAQPAAGCTHVPEIAADQVTLTGIEMQNGRKRRVCVRLRLAIAEASAHGAGVGAGSAIELRQRPFLA